MIQDLLTKLSAGSPLTGMEIVSRLLLALILTTPIAAIYSKNYRGYGRPAQMTLVLILVSLTTTGIIMAIGNNLALSLGMVGALSIVRFRAAVKDNRDLAYLFWSLAIGLVCGAGVFMLAMIQRLAGRRIRSSATIRFSACSSSLSLSLMKVIQLGSIFIGYRLTPPSRSSSWNTSPKIAAQFPRLISSITSTTGVVELAAAMRASVNGPGIKS